MTCPESSRAAAPPPRVVLDTNACLDLFVFGDPALAALQSALSGGEVVPITNDECRDEWLRVLRYPILRLDEPAIAAAVARFDARVTAPDPARVAAPVRLPRCADPDDQKFLQLAHAGGARWLLSRDKALLALSRRVERDGLFRILPPAAWHPDA